MSDKKMKTLCIEQPGKVTILENPVPKRKPGEALLKLLYGGICGSDLSTYRGVNAYASYPLVPGHEFAAEIVEIDENDQGLRPGMVVTGNPYFNCGHCYACDRGFVNACMTNETLGVHRDGAFSQFFTLPIERIYDGKGLDAKTLALIEPFCISYHGVQRAKVQKGDHVLVIGAGTIGVLAAVAAKAMGADVCLCDVSEAKLDFVCETFGIENKIVNISKEVFDHAVAEHTDGHGFDAVIEAVGIPETFRSSLEACCYGGKVSLVGVSKKNIDDFFFTIIQKKELEVYGSRNALKKDFLELIDLVKTEQIPLHKLITSVYAWQDAAAAFEDYHENVGKMLKVMLDFTR